MSPTTVPAWASHCACVTGLGSDNTFAGASLEGPCGCCELAQPTRTTVMNQRIVWIRMVKRRGRVAAEQGCGGDGLGRARSEPAREASEPALGTFRTASGFTNASL